MGKRSEGYVSNRVNTIVGKGTVFDGTLHTLNETVRIEGLVKGKIISEGVLIIGNGGNVEGRIEGNVVCVGGTVRGEIFANRIEANPTGVIIGDLHTRSLIVDDKASFEGRCQMIRDEEPKKPVKKATKSSKASKATSETPQEEETVIVTQEEEQ